MKPTKPKHTPRFDDVRMRYETGKPTCYVIDGISAENAENIRGLIAAAPEMLDAIEHGINECMRAYKVTAKLETQDHPQGAFLNELIMRLNETLKSAKAKATGGAE